MGVVEGAAGGALDVDAVLQRATHVLAMPYGSALYAGETGGALARDVLALVADREALLERIKLLESGSGTAACSGGVPDALHRLEGLESVRRCNDPDPNGDGMRLCDLWPDHEGPHVNVSSDDGVTEWRNR